MIPVQFSVFVISAAARPVFSVIAVAACPEFSAISVAQNPVFSVCPDFRAPGGLVVELSPISVKLP
jgi:hypothetical protein